MADFNIITFILEDLLRIAPKFISQYSTISDQLLYLILVPHVLLFLFIFAFAIGIVGRIIGPHAGFRNIVGVTAYLVIVLSGWYGSFLIPWFNTWFTIALVMGLLMFVTSIIFNPARSPVMANVLSSAGKKITGGIGAKRQKEKELAIVEAQIQTLISNPVQPGGHAHAVREMQLQQLRLKQTQLLREIS
jgi:hypothetical protein